MEPSKVSILFSLEIRFLSDRTGNLDFAMETAIFTMETAIYTLEFVIFDVETAIFNPEKVISLLFNPSNFAESRFTGLFQTHKFGDEAMKMMRSFFSRRRISSAIIETRIDSLLNRFDDRLIFKFDRFQIRARAFV